MKKVFFLIVIAFSSILLLTNSLAQPNTLSSNSNKVVKIYYFHSTNRCATCNAVENNAKSLIEEKYKDQVSKGLLQFQSINIDDKANKNLVNKYKIAFSTLLIINPDGTVNDFTNTAFQYAKSNPTKYKELLIVEINKSLK